MKLLQKQFIKNSDAVRRTDWSWHFLASPVLISASLTWTSLLPDVSHRHTDTTCSTPVTRAITTRWAASCVNRLVACWVHVSSMGLTLVSRAGNAWAGNSRYCDLVLHHTSFMSHLDVITCMTIYTSAKISATHTAGYLVTYQQTMPTWPTKAKKAEVYSHWQMKGHKH